MGISAKEAYSGDITMKKTGIVILILLLAIVSNANAGKDDTAVIAKLKAQIVALEEKLAQKEALIKTLSETIDVERRDDKNIPQGKYRSVAKAILAFDDITFEPVKQPKGCVEICAESGGPLKIILRNKWLEDKK